MYFSLILHQNAQNVISVLKTQTRICAFFLGFNLQRNTETRENVKLSAKSVSYRVSHETWQLVNSFECRLPYTVLDYKIFAQTYFTLKLILL